MELRQLHYFLVVAEELHFGKAAQRLHIAEQPLGYQIRKLEGELGFKLLNRTTRSVSLTAAGAAFMEDARKILEQSQRAAENARRIAQGKAGKLRLGYESATVPSILPSFVRFFREEFPEIELELMEYSQVGLTALVDGETDACLATRYTRLPSSIEYHRIRNDATYIALPRGHALSSKPELSIFDVANEQFLGYRGMQSAPANLFLQQLIATTDLEMPVIQEAESFTTLLGLVAAGLGFTIVTGCARQFFANEVDYRPLTNPAITVDYGLALRKGDTAPIADSARSVAKHLADRYKRQMP